MLCIGLNHYRAGGLVQDGTCGIPHFRLRDTYQAVAQTPGKVPRSEREIIYPGRRVSFPIILRYVAVLTQELDALARWRGAQ